jgi:hypothetical protein
LDEGKVGCIYRYPRLMDNNVASRLLRGKKKLLIIGRCLEVEKPWAIEKFSDEEYAKLTVCLEETHVNMAGFKLAGILARIPFEEVAVLTTDGSMHCIQLHFMVEEIFRLMKLPSKRRHFVVSGSEIVEIPHEAVKTARYLSKVAKLIEKKACES